MNWVGRALILTLALGAISSAACAEEPKFLVAGYLPNYRLATWAGETGPLTDLIVFGVPAPDEGVFDASAIEPGLKRLRELKAQAGLRLLMTVGGWKQSAEFASWAADRAVRQRFIRDARAFCLRHGFDGVDYDWEHPRGAGELAAYAALLQETRAEFAPHQLLVTVALASWQDLGRATYAAVDRVHLMTYDHAFPQATLEKSQADVARLIAAGCPRAKIVLGLPFYGRNAQGAAKSYAELAAGAAVDASIINGFALNSPDLIAQKVRYARAEKFAGVMIWELGQDAPGPGSLLRVIGAEVE